jgi:recombination protein RecT
MMAEEKKQGIMQYIIQPKVRDRINVRLGKSSDVKAFMDAMIMIASSSPALSRCRPESIVTAGLECVALGFNPSPRLGLVWFIPYGNTCTLQLGYKALIQLIVESGMYRRCSVNNVKKSEFIKWDPFEEKLDYVLNEDPVARDKEDTVGYLAYMECTNGFIKRLYWTKEQVVRHAETYSPGYTKSRIWITAFDAMAQKTVLIQLLSRWGIKNNRISQAIEIERRNR